MIDTNRNRIQTDSGKVGLILIDSDAAVRNDVTSSFCQVKMMVFYMYCIGKSMCVRLVWMCQLVNVRKMHFNAEETGRFDQDIRTLGRFSKVFPLYTTLILYIVVCMCEKIAASAQSFIFFFFTL